MLRHIALNLLKQESSIPSMKGKRLVAGWNNEYLLKVLGIVPPEEAKQSA